jgi:hypothetical protein
MEHKMKTAIDPAQDATLQRRLAIKARRIAKLRAEAKALYVEAGELTDDLIEEVGPFMEGVEKIRLGKIGERALFLKDNFFKGNVTYRTTPVSRFDIVEGPDKE